MTCPYCEELKRRGIEDPILAIEDAMIRHNFYVRRVVDFLGYEKATEIAAAADAHVSAETAKERQ